MSSSNYNAPGWSTEPNPFPTARRDADAAITYKSASRGEITIPEPYVWLETPPSQSQETKDWVTAQAALTESYLKGCQPDLDLLKSRIQKNFDYARTHCPSLEGDGRYYYKYNSGLSPQSLVYRATVKQVEARAGKDERNPIGEIFFDTNLLSSDGTIALKTISFSKTGKYVAYGISKSGSDWFQVFFRSTDKPFRLAEGSYNPNGTFKLSKEEVNQYVDAQGGKDRMDDVLDNLKFSSISWDGDKGVFYHVYPTVSISDKGTETDSTKESQLWYHRIGTPQEQDILVIDKDPRLPTSRWESTISDDGNYLIVTNATGTIHEYRVFVAPLHTQEISNNLEWIPVALDFKYDLEYVANDGDRFYFVINKDAPRYRFVYADVDASCAKSASHVANLTGSDIDLHDVIPEDKHALLISAHVVSENKLLVVYSRDVKEELYQYELKTGKQVERLLPDLVGTVSQLSTRRHDHHAFVRTVSFINPGQIMRFDWKEGSEGSDKPASQKLFLNTKVAGLEAQDFTSEQVFFTSKDGTQVPMFLTYPKTTKRDGTSPALVYFYGGFNHALTPAFSTIMMTWISSYNGVLAYVGCRGGNEYGDEWHEAGMRFNKQNVFDDALSAAKYLHESKYAAKGKIILSGGSNGGLGAAACANQLEEEHGVGAIIASVGVMDMLKYHHWTVGKSWICEFGDPSEDPEIFDYILNYSPLHNVNPLTRSTQPWSWRVPIMTTV